MVTTAAPPSGKVADYGTLGNQTNLQDGIPQLRTSGG
jgi:hypothetical protein